jgi:PAS domain S-box-containing protein/excisionase family DNA binding protein
MPTSHLLTTEEIADLLHTHPVTVRRLFREQRLPGTRIGKRWYISQEDFERWFKSQSENHVDSETRPHSTTGEYRVLVAQISEEARRASETLMDVLQAAPIAISILGLDGTVKFWNPAAENLFGWTAAEVMGKFLPAIPEDMREQFVSHLQTIRAGEQIIGKETRRQKKSGIPIQVQLWAVPIWDNDGSMNCLSMIADISERKQAEERKRVLQELTAAFSRAVTPMEVADVIVDSAVPALGGHIGGVYFLTGDVLESVATRRDTENCTPRHRAPLDAPLPLTTAARTRHPVWLENAEAIGAHFPLLLNGGAPLHFQASVCLPLLIHERVIGAMLIGFPQARTFNPQEQEFFLALAEHSAQALERARLYEAEQKAHLEAQQAANRLLRLHQVTAALGEALTVRDVAKIVVDQVVDVLGAMTGTFQILVENNTVFEIVYMVGGLLNNEESAQWERYPADPGFMSTRAFQTRQALWFEDGAQVAKEFPALAHLTEVYPGATAHLPIQVGSHVVGVLSLAFAEKRSFSPEERTFILSLMQQCGQAVERARLYEAEAEARREAEQKSDWLSRLQQVTNALSQAITIPQFAQIIVEQAAAVMRADTASLNLKLDQGKNFALAYLLGGKLPPDEIEQWQRYPANPIFPSVDAVLRGEPLWFESMDDLSSRYPVMAQFRTLYPGASAILPISVKGEGMASLVIGFTHKRAFTSEERAFLLTLAEQCAQALERAQLYEAEHRARLKAEQADWLKLQFLAMISHELRTPLTSIKGFTTTLLAEDVTWDAPSQRQFLQVMNYEADKLTDLIEQLLDLSRLQAGTLRILPVPDTVSGIMAEALPQLERLAAKHHLSLSLPEPAIPILADRQRIIQVLSNLVENAVKYAPEQTVIAVSVQPAGEMVQFAVSDEGIGIPENDQQLVFEAFRQVERKREEQRKGAGLGLAICKGLVETHGGKIWIQPKETPGTTVVFTLPVLREA